MKQLAYSTQHLLKASTGTDFKRAHIYELLAGYYGFNSYAALCASSVFTEQFFSSRISSSYTLLLQGRCTEIGYPARIAETVAKVLPPFLTEREIGVVGFSDLMVRFRFESGRPRALASPILMDELMIAADRGNADAHYVLALIHSDGEDGEHEVGSEYWYQQAQAGRILTGVAKEWADAHAARIARADWYVRHLREAARLGQQDAMLELADRFNDPTFFEQANAQVGVDHFNVAEIAEKLGRVEDARKWFTKAAVSGDTEAMCHLIEHYNHGDLQQCWTWIYLAELLGTDLTQNEYYAIHEDGSPYDDDVGGNMYCDGRDGIDLRPISSEQDSSARRAAQEIFEGIGRSED